MRKTEVTLQDGRNLVLEEGMNWITCAGAENPVYRLATKYNISMVLQDWEKVAVYGNGTMLSTDLTLPRWDFFYEAWYKLLEVEEDLNSQVFRCKFMNNFSRGDESNDKKETNQQK